MSTGISFEDSEKNIPIRLRNMRKFADENYTRPFVVISGAWNIPGTISWLEIKGKGNKTNKDLEQIGSKIKRDVEKITENIINHGWKVIVGGALGVDYFATKKIYDMKKLDQLLIMFPSEKYAYLERLSSAYLDKDIITRDQLNEISGLLDKISKEHSESVYIPRFEECDENKYLIRNSREVFLGDFLCAFHVDDTEGTKDTIEKFKKSKKPVYVHRYEVLKNGWTENYKEHIYNIEKSPISKQEIENIFRLSENKATTTL
ncbi:MAG: hypothetical protein AABW83_04210 [Nanoarchaeota archaeon]